MRTLYTLTAASNFATAAMTGNLVYTAIGLAFLVRYLMTFKK